MKKNTRKGYGPILVYGENVKTGGAHAWVVDGYDKGTTATNMYSNLSYIATFVKDSNRGSVTLQ